MNSARSRRIAVSTLAAVALLAGTGLTTSASAQALGSAPPAVASSSSAWFSDVTKALDYVYTQKDNYSVAAVNLSLGGFRR